MPIEPFLILFQIGKNKIIPPTISKLQIIMNLFYGSNINMYKHRKNMNKAQKIMYSRLLIFLVFRVSVLINFV